MKHEEKPSLVKINEFLNSVSGKYPVESLGGFIYWMKRQGIPPKWPVAMWKQKLEEYLSRKI